MSVKEAINQLSCNPKIGTAIATSTVGTGISSWLDLIPDDIGKLATVVGIVLSVILIYANILKIGAEKERLRMERDMFEAKLKEKD